MPLLRPLRVEVQRGARFDRFDFRTVGFDGRFGSIDILAARYDRSFGSIDHSSHFLSIGSIDILQLISALIECLVFLFIYVDVACPV